MGQVHQGGAIFNTLWPARALSCHVSGDYLRRNEKNEVFYLTTLSADTNI